MYTIPRFDNENRNMVNATRVDWIEECIQKKEKFSIHCIFGEVSSLSLIKTVLDNENYRNWCESIEIVFGKKLYNTQNKAELKEYLKKYPELLKMYSCNYRPVDHGIILRNNIIYEQEHPSGVGYQKAVVIERADQEACNIFMSSFNTHKANARPTDQYTIDAVETEV